MACNCATQEQLNELFKKYGEKSKVGNNAPLSQRMKAILVSIGTKIGLAIVCIPLFLYVVYIAIFTNERKISLKKFFRLKENETSEFSKRINEAVEALGKEV